MPSVIFWDNDGVLVDTERIFFRATSDVLAEVGVTLSEAQFKDISLHRGGSAFDLVRDSGFSEQKVAALRDDRNERFTQLLVSRDPLIDGVADVLGRLGATHRMAIVTSSRRVHFDAAHSRTGILHHFEFVLTIEDYERTKPNPDPYLTALDRAGVEPRDAVVIEDSPRGLRAARAAGIPCLVVPNDLSVGGDFDGAAGLLADVGQVPAAVAALD